MSLLKAAPQFDFSFLNSIIVGYLQCSLNWGNSVSNHKLTECLSVSNVIFPVLDTSNINVNVKNYWSNKPCYSIFDIHFLNFFATFSHGTVAFWIELSFHYISVATVLRWSNFFMQLHHSTPAKTFKKFSQTSVVKKVFFLWKNWGFTYTNLHNNVQGIQQ